MSKLKKWILLEKEPVFKRGGKIPIDKPIIVELFCGCGGTSLGFEMAGFEVVLGCDIHAPSIETSRLTIQIVQQFLRCQERLNRR